MLKSVNVSDYTLPNPPKVLANDDIFTAMEVITHTHASGVCVVDEENNLVGMLSEMDCLKAVLSATYNKSGSAGQVSDFMVTDVFTCNVDADIIDVASDMLKTGHRRRPVVDNGKLVGQITCRQVLRVVSSFYSTKK